MTRAELARELRTLRAEEVAKLLRELLEETVPPPPDQAEWIEQVRITIQEYRPALERLAKQ